MLPLWRNRLTIILHPTQVTIIERTRNMRRYAGSPVIHTVDGSAADYAWQAPLGALREWLRENKRARANVKIIVSDRYAQYALIPWPRGIVSNRELKTYARLYFANLFGHDGADWHLNVDWSRYAQPGVGCALPSGLVDAIRDVCAEQQLRIGSISGNFIVTHGRWRNRLHKGDALFVVIDSDQCTFAGFRRGHWLGLRSVRMEHATEALLTAAIKRELLLQGMPAEALVYLHMNQHGIVWRFDALGARLRMLDASLAQYGLPAATEAG